MSNSNPAPKRNPEAPHPGQEAKRVIVPDEEFERLVDDNAEQAWLKYCELNGLDPSTGKEG